MVTAGLQHSGNEAGRRLCTKGLEVYVDEERVSKETVAEMKEGLRKDPMSQLSLVRCGFGGNGFRYRVDSNARIRLEQ